MVAAETETGPEPGVPSHPGPVGHGGAGRDLVAALVVGLVLAVLTLAALLVPVIFATLTVAACAVAGYELTVAFRSAGIQVPLVPFLLGVGAIGVGAYTGSATGVIGALGGTVIVACLWRLPRGRVGYIRDVTAAMFGVMYVPFLASFAVLLLRDGADGQLRVLCFLLVTVASDVGGYATGVLFGRHPLAPTVSPKKSWEGLAGSVVLCLAAGLVSVPVLLDGPWWAGLILGAVTPVVATSGDLIVSMVKRDLGLKDMGSVLPGHGGIMDRLDSLLPMAFVSWLVLSLLVPAG